MVEEKWPQRQNIHSAVSKVDYKSRALIPRLTREVFSVPSSHHHSSPRGNRLIDLVGVFVHVSVGACGDQKRAPGPLDLELQEVRRNQKWVPGIGLKSSAGGTGT